MADDFSFEVPDLAAYIRELHALPKAIRDRVAKGAVATGASVIRKEAVQRAPIYTGKVQAGHPPPGTLKRAIYQTRLVEFCDATTEVWKVDVRRGSTARSTRGKNKGQRNLGQDAYYAMWVEYGHYTRTPSKKNVIGSRSARQKMGIDFGSVRWVPAQPYMRPAFEAKKNAAVQSIQQYLRERLPDATEALKFIKANTA